MVARGRARDRRNEQSDSVGQAALWTTHSQSHCLHVRLFGAAQLVLLASQNAQIFGNVAMFANIFAACQFRY